MELLESEYITSLQNLFVEQVNKGHIPSIEYMSSLGHTENEIESFNEYYYDITSMEFIMDFLNDKVTELIFHSPSYLQKLGGNDQKQIIDVKDWQLRLDIFALKSQQTWNHKTPFCSFSTIIGKHDFRATLVHYSLSHKQSSKLFLRKHSESIIPLEAFNVQDDLKNKLECFIATKKSVLISGSTGSGKTSILNSVLNFTPDTDHTIIIEDTFEIQHNKTLTTRLLSEESTHKSMTKYLEYAMRMSPDRIILGEMRGAEVVPFILGLNTGHKGMLSTVHANNASDALHRLAMLFTLYSEQDGLDYNFILKLITQNIDYVIHMENKQIKEIIEVYSCENGNVYFEDILNM